MEQLADNEKHNVSGTALIAGAGPAGVTAAVELLRRSNVRPVIMESADYVGGISRTVNYKGNRIDIGGHRFFSKNDTVMQWWTDLLPVQGEPSVDDKILGVGGKHFVDNGPNPEKTDTVMLIRHRVSRIFYLRKFFDYPISIKWQTFANMGIVNTLNAGCGYMYSALHKRKERTLEDFYINRFGRPLYKMFFEDYTTKVWGVHPSKLGADWGAQRVKGLSIFAILKDVIAKQFRSNNDINQKNTETSLIEQFIYPKLGPGQLWEVAAEKVKVEGGEVNLNKEVVHVNISEGKVQSVDVRNADGSVDTVACDYFISSMPLKSLLPALRGIEVPADVMRVAVELPYRDFVMAGLLIDKLKIKNETKIKTIDSRVPDTWVYIQERDVKIGRLQIFNNWSPYMVADFENTMWIGLEYFCSEGDELWNMSDADFIKMATDELVKINIIDKDAVRDSVRIRMKKAYPSYMGTYYELDKVKSFLNSIPNLYCIGRNGQHRYNNMDHSMLTAIEAVNSIATGKTDKSNIWAVNTENAYHEEK